MVPYRPVITGDNLSSPEAAVLLLVWQQPTDRALSGWMPYPGIRAGEFTGEGLFHWLKEKMRSSMGEEDDLRRLRSVD